MAGMEASIAVALITAVTTLAGAGLAFRARATDVRTMTWQSLVASLREEVARLRVQVDECEMRSDKQDVEIAELRRKIEGTRHG